MLIYNVNSHACLYRLTQDWRFMTSIEMYACTNWAKIEHIYDIHSHVIVYSKLIMFPCINLILF